MPKAYFTSWVNTRYCRPVLQPNVSQQAHLTNREAEVLTLICQEHTNSEIADRLFVSVRTVETLRKDVLEKLGAKNAVGLVIKAVEFGLFEVKPSERD